jgi:hypothetical protein
MNPDGSPGAVALTYARYDGSGTDAEDFALGAIPASGTPSEYSVAMDDAGNALVAVSYAPNGGQLGEIEYFLITKGAVGEADVVTNFRDDRSGVSPQVIWDGTTFQVAYYGESTDTYVDVTEVETEYPIDPKTGLPTDPVVTPTATETTEETTSQLYWGVFDPAVGVASAAIAGGQDVGRPFRMVAADDGPVITWVGLTNQTGSLNDMTSTLYSAKLAVFENGGQTVASLGGAQTLGSTKYSIQALDVTGVGTGVRVLGLVADTNPDSTTYGGASVYQFAGDFDQQIAINRTFDYANVVAGSTVPVTFTVTNQGFQPITSITLEGIGDKVDIGSVTAVGEDGAEQQVQLELLPGQAATITGLIAVPADGVLTNGGKYTGTVKATFSGGSQVTASAEVDLNTTDLQLLLTNPDGVLGYQLSKLSTMQLPSTAKIEVGLYRDAGFQM